MTRKKKHVRRRARESALALLYSSDITELDVTKIVENGAYPADGIELPEYGEALLIGMREHLAEIDEKLAATSENWAVGRMPIVDRAILRLGVYEMLFVDEVPISVAINEAVELAKIYGGEDESARFVNGVLGRIARMIEPDADEEAGNDIAAPDDGEPAVDDAADVDVDTSAGADAESGADDEATAESEAQEAPESEERGVK